ncbi:MULTISPECIES: M23 family metallopeptidase [unclassified Nodularia (in: cyanobacteria)]|uniref:M23 family metallopeptidase n=1 Tax=unclassified Nodularia (in: cyanobacteria) TaxID=2656917 RepID=UPI0018818467|nr:MULTISPECIES: M23 family metallopeptidase [unclassified Nodularia (in: cyanobacteria)]MBE9199198.1 M23 family metallopeptidase [Nodularia sp. LEGE 06071]MCC2695656.1 M23 family metallopeptidase [Nodularia sp. LEGE 04288]
MIMFIKKAHIITYGLITLMSLINVLSINTFALTELVQDSPIQHLPIADSNLIWPTQGLISQGFRKYQHEGIDIAGASGTPIFAAASGAVVKAGWDNWGLGKAIEIKHLDQSVTVYGHNRRLFVSQGQKVEQGQIIAEMGSTGNSSAPHLHFEFYPNGRVAADPIRLLASATTNQKPPSPPMPINPAPVSFETECSGVTILQGETANNLIKICQDNDQLFYLGQLKQKSSTPIKILAWNIGQDRYRADNGTFSYLVNSEGVEIWRNGLPIRTDIFYSSN